MNHGGSQRDLQGDCEHVSGVFLMLHPDAIPPKTRRHLSFDPLIRQIRLRAKLFPDTRNEADCSYSMADAVMSAMAMFALKDPSLLFFQQRRNDENMKSLFRILNVPSDTQMRAILDPLEPDLLRPLFNDVFRQLQRGKALEPYVFHEGCYLVSMDGTGYFSSKKIHCDCCLQKKNSKTGEITYYHQMLGAAVVHPDHKQVIPLAPEPIMKQDGDNKNDCERNAGKRLLQKIRDEHPNLKLVVVEDGLASNAPHIRHLKDLEMHFILGAKPDDHEHLFEELSKAEEEGRVTTLRWADEAKKKEVQCEIRFAHDLPLNKSNADLLVNFLQYTEYASDGSVRKRFSWVTDLTITRENARHLVRGGRARWKIENETFNTLKNQDYHFEHNFGHGEQNLSTIFAMLMMLAFLVDQTQELCCPLFQAVRRKLVSRRSLWDHQRSHFRHCRFESMQHLHEAILYDLAKELPVPTFASHRRAKAP
jgi:hypothetical protein